jgi:hypothetical protein
MKSTTSPAPAPAPVTTEYTHTFSNNTTHIWNIRSSSAASVISDFYLHENMSSTDNRQPGHTQINKSFPRHHALVCASLGSSHDIIARDLEAAATGGGVVCRKRYAATAAAARAHAHDTRHVTHFTTISAYQKHHIASMSGLAGLVVARWIGLRSARPHTIKTAKTHAELTAKYIHSALSCEILIGNRYYRGLPTLLTDLRIVGSDNSSSMALLTTEDITPKGVAITKTELLEIYAAQIERLLRAVKQYKRGFVSLESIRTDPEFGRLMHAYWRYCNQVMKVQYNFEESRDNDYHDDTKSLFVMADVCSVCAMVPQLYNYDVVHLLDNTKQSYAKFVKTARNTLVRISNDGLTMAFLSFAAIEPQMTTSEMAPKHGTDYLTTTIASCTNHIPSRHPLFGELRVKHREHIPRTADAVGDIGIPRYSARVYPGHGYSPLHDTVENIRAGRCQSSVPVITYAAKAYAARQVAAVAAAAAAEVADGWVICSRRKRNE